MEGAFVRIPDRIIYCHRPFKLCKRKTWVPGIIQLVTGKYFHAARLCNLGGCYVVLDATTKKGVAITPRHRWFAERKDQELKQVDAERNLQAAEIVEHLGKDYDFACGWAHFWLKLTGCWVGRKLTADRKMYCFELQARLEGKKKWWQALPEIN